MDSIFVASFWQNRQCSLCLFSRRNNQKYLEAKKISMTLHKPTTDASLSGFYFNFFNYTLKNDKEIIVIHVILNIFR